MKLFSLLLLAGCVVISNAGLPIRNKYAYATLHYEGTPNDASYILGVRVLIRSLRSSRFPFIVLASDSVSQSSREIFEKEGAIIRMVSDVPNPFSHGLARFKYTFNKLHLWNMTDFERVIYFDADNVVVDVSKTEELFMCGHFCIVYMNPCHFHTGLLVVKPDKTVMNDMLTALPTTGSYDGADQGFLSKYFEACDDAPMFNPAKGISEARLNQLHISYNMHAFYRLATGSFERFRCGPFEKTEQAAASIGYPIPVMVKPWNWWVGILGHTYEWNQIRMTLDEPEWLPIAFITLFIIAAFYLLFDFILKYLTRDQVPVVTAKHQLLTKIGLKVSSAAICVISVLVINMFAVDFIPPTIRPLWGILLYGCFHFACMSLIARSVAFYIYCVPAQLPWKSWRYCAIFYVTLFMARPMDRAIAFAIGWGFLVPALRAIIVWGGFIISQIYIFLHIAQASPIFNHLT